MKVNGKEVEFKEKMSILNLLDNYNLDKNKVVVEVNFQILEPEVFEEYIVNKEDEIEIISFVGGG
ncbi:MAG: sulfur carrier protein ThiS [Clostridioides sp.]|jgi:sulfur carrier protein|nr:sulfur carrier protein ThiS [Clostridioides sp.]